MLIAARSSQDLAAVDRDRKRALKNTTALLFHRTAGI
jgi:hypothetical protein